MKSMTYRGMLITAHAVEVGGGSTGFQYRYRGEIERDAAEASEAAEFEPPLGRYFANAGAAIEQCLADGRQLVDAIDPVDTMTGSMVEDQGAGWTNQYGSRS